MFWQRVVDFVDCQAEENEKPLAKVYVVNEIQFVPELLTLIETLTENESIKIEASNVKVQVLCTLYSLLELCDDQSLEAYSKVQF